LGPLLAQTALASRLASVSKKTSGVNTFVLDPAGTVLDQPPFPAPAYLVAFTSRLASEKKATSARTTNEAHTKVVDAGAPISGGWGVVLEQDATSFDLHSTVQKLPPEGVAVIVVLFGLLILVLAVTDARRRTAMRYAD